jgi:RluA family pseudouridine synthase
VKRAFRVALGDPPRLQALLAVRLAVSDEAAAALLHRGAVELDGRRTREDTDVATGARVIAFLPDDAAAVDPTPLVVAYRDAHVVVVDKPAGLRSQDVRGDDWNTLIARVQREIDPRASLLHRLDRDTSGLVLLPLDDRARVTLQAALAAADIDRRYAARVAGRMEAPRTIDLRIAVDATDRRRRIALPATDPGGENARTDVEPYAHDAAETRVRLRLHTGRTHQIRVHLRAVGHPIVGDSIYGGPPSGRLRLHAYAITFPHPRSGTPRRVETDLRALDE